VCGQPWLPPTFQRQAPTYLGQFLFWVGLPVSLVHFLRQADLSGGVWLSPVIAWVAFGLSLALAWGWLRGWGRSWSEPTKGTFLLAAMVGNTGYIGYAVVLLLPSLGIAYFGWAIFYDLLGTLFTAYGVGVIIGANYGRGVGAGRSLSPWYQSFAVVFKAPTIPSFLLGLLLRAVAFPPWLDASLRGFAWAMVMLSLALMGMRLQQLRSWGKLPPAIAATVIRMVIAPALVGLCLTGVGLEGAPRLVMVLQAGMPSAFATLVLTETFNLDRDLAVTTVGFSSLVLLLTLPLWLVIFPV
ncbi:MAG TPA: AEC family transporter, partial [Candidatus Obscuribacterales bacterium]